MSFVHLALFRYLLLACNIGAICEDIVYNYQESPLYVYVGQCVNFSAKSHFSTIDRQTDDVDITWKKDTHVFDEKRAWHFIGYARVSDAAFYQVEIKNKTYDIIKRKTRYIIEETFFWLNVRQCKANEKESPGVTTKCKTSCVEMCPSGWHYLQSSNGDRCYRYYGDPKTWLEARDHCQTVGAQLAITENAQENSFIGSLAKSADGSWIGLNDRLSETKFVWNYDKTNTKKPFTAWAANEPNNYNADCNIENCVIMSGSSGKWSDVICNAFYPFVCQRPKGNYAEWRCLDTKCYRFFGQLLMWVDAQLTCKTFGGVLATINNQKENDFVNEIIFKDSWIGLNDIAEAGGFVWNQITYSASKLSYTNWMTGQPNDMVFEKAYGRTCDGEDCVILKTWQSNTTWFDVSCDKKNPYVCEKIRGSLLSTGMLIGILVGSMIGVVVIAGAANSMIRKRSRSQARAFILNAYDRRQSVALERETTINRLAKYAKQLR